jgi:hypothetical protein
MGMPKILTWRTLGTSLERISMVDRSDPIAASAYSRSSSQDCSSRSSLRTRRGSKAPRLQNRSDCPHHSLGLRRVGIRSPLPKTGRGSACSPPRRRDPLQSTQRIPSLSTYWASPRLRRRASDHRPRQRRPSSPYGRDWGGRGRPRAAAPQPSQHQRRRAAPRANQRRPRQELMPAPATR